MLNPDIELRHSSWQTVAAVACFVIAVLAGIGGSLLTTGWVLNAQLHPWLHAVGLVLLILAFPILILSGHCLDLQDRKANTSRDDPQGQGNSKTTMPLMKRNR